jgi:hypothetical protein
MKSANSSFQFVLGIIAAGLIAGQSAEPTYPNSFYAVGNGILIQLEHQTASIRTRMRALPGYASVKVMAEIEPGRSPVRLATSTTFIVRGRSPIDPATRYELRELKASKHRREFMMTRAHGTLLGGHATSALEEGDVPIRFENYGTDSYRVTPEAPLGPGEYALSLRGLTQLYCFGIDR